MDRFKKTFGFISNKILLPACGFYTILTFIVILAGYSITDKPAVTGGSAITILFFSLVLSIINLIFRANFNIFAKIGIHFVLSLLSLIMILILCSGFYSDKGTSSSLVIVGIYAAVYFVLAFPVILIKHSLTKKNQPKNDYSNVYKK